MSTNMITWSTFVKLTNTIYKYAKGQGKLAEVDSSSASSTLWQLKHTSTMSHSSTYYSGPPNSVGRMAERKGDLGFHNTRMPM